MKKMNFLAVLVTIVMACVGCDTKSDALVAPAPSKPTTPQPSTPDPKDDPEETDTTKWSWNGLVRSDLSFDTTTEMISAYNIGQISNPNRVVFDSIPLVYHLGLELKAPKRVVVESQDSTVLRTAHTNPTLNYSEYIRSSKDSVCSVSTGHVFPTSYYDINATTTSKRGYSLHAGHWEPFKYTTESAQWKNIWHEPITEIVLNDSVFNREVVHNELTFVIRSNKGQTWYVTREEVVIVDHFLRMKEKKEVEEEKKEETAEFNTPGFTELLAYVRVHDVDKKQWNDAILLETTDAYYIVNIPFSYNSKKETYCGKKYITKYDKESIGKVSVKLNGVIYVKGKFYPAYITEDASGWYGVWSSSIDQSVDMNEATASGLKNQPKNGNAKGSCFVEKAVSKSTSGNILSVTGKTIGHTITTTFKIK